eukprot:3087161-Rhodomonas_salina.2
MKSAIGSMTESETAEQTGGGPGSLRVAAVQLDGSEGEVVVEFCAQQCWEESGQPDDSCCNGELLERR